MSYDPEERALREKLAETAIRAYRRGLVAGTGGNVSARIPGKNEVLITPTGVSLELTTVENIVKTDLYATPADPDCPHKPSKETGFHCAIYRVRPEVNAIVHVHPPYATAFSHRFQDLPLSTVGASAGLRRVPCIEVALSGSAELRSYVEEAFSTDRSIKAIIMRAHGIIGTGADLVAAYDVADLVEATAKIAYLAVGLGVPIEDVVEVSFRPLPRA
ncbi:MAG: class II aldolase/adducin family protein [Sphingomonadaceae bacterium]